MSAMALAYLSILPRTIIGFLTDGTAYSTNIILFTYNTRETEDTICLKKKIKQGITQKTQKDWLTEIQVLTKRFTKRVF